MKTHKFDTIRREKAQAAVELALTIPIVLVLILGIIEGGLLIFVYASLTAAGREAARYGAGVGYNINSGTNLYNDCDGIKAAALRVGQFAGIKTDDIHIYHDRGPNTTPVTEYCRVGDPPASFAQDDRIKVEIDIIYTPISPLVRLPSFHLYSKNAHTVVLGSSVVAVRPQTCDVSNYIVFSQTSKKGKTDTIVIRNNSGTETSIVNVLIVWDPSPLGSSSPFLKSISYDISGISGIPGLTGLPTTTNSYYSSPAGFSMSFPKGDSSFTLNFSRELKSNVIIRLTLSGVNKCAFGQ